MIKHLLPAIMLTVLMTALTGLAYPLAMTGVAGLLFPYQAKGSLIERDGKIIGSELIGQNFTGDGYFHGRPSATTDTDPNDATKTVPAPYNASNSSGSELWTHVESAGRPGNGRLRPASGDESFRQSSGRSRYHLGQRP